jgi:hypothetical protein
MISFRSRISQRGICSSVLLELQRSSFPERLIPRRLLQRSSEYGEDYSAGVLEPHWSNLLHDNLFFLHVFSFDEIAARKFLFLEKSFAKGNTAVCYFKKVQSKNDI